MQGIDFIDKELQHRRNSQQLRHLRDVLPVGKGPMVEIDGRRLVNFSSNDYLGLAHHEALIKGTINFTEKFGAGSTASRLVCGSLPIFSQIEKKLAGLKKTESALLFNSGFQTNVSLISAFTDRNALVIADRLCHNSIIQGVLLSRCRLIRYRHNDLDHLEDLLAKHADGKVRKLVVTESVFSMDGDQCDIDIFSELCRKYGAVSMVDEAHATGVLGENGMGMCCGKDIDLIMGTFGKGCGCFGAYIACSEQIKKYLVNFCSGFIYTTALPPAILGAIDASLDLVPLMKDQRAHLHGLADYLRSALSELGFGTGNSTTQIVPIIVGDDYKAVSLSNWLEENNILAVSIRPPTVEPGQARIRIAISVSHSKQQVDSLVNACKSWKY